MLANCQGEPWGHISFQEGWSLKYLVVLKKHQSFLLLYLCQNIIWILPFRSSRPNVFLVKGVLKICIFTGEHLCRSAISIKLKFQLYWNHTSAWCSPEKLLHIFRKPFPKSTIGWSYLDIIWKTWSTTRFFMLLWESFCKKMILKNPSLRKMLRKPPTSNAWPQFSKTLIFLRVC